MWLWDKYGVRACVRARSINQSTKQRSLFYARTEKQARRTNPILFFHMDGVVIVAKNENKGS